MKRILKPLALFLLLCTLMTVVPFAALADMTVTHTDAMTEIESNLSQYKLGSTKTVSKDSYLGIPLEISVYFDQANNTVITGGGLDSTPVMVYVVNTMMERVGTDSDTEIIQSMMDRGYIVVVFDYLNNAKAVSPDLDWSVQDHRDSVVKGTYLNEIAGLPKGNYYNNMVVPAGNNIEFNLIYWEFDKHCADGTFDKIVEVWNNDFRSWNSEKVIKWTDDNDNRKATQKGFDLTDPVWYDDAAGNVIDDNGDVLCYTFTVDALTDDYATITFTKK